MHYEALLHLHRRRQLVKTQQYRTILPSSPLMRLTDLLAPLVHRLHVSSSPMLIGQMVLDRGAKIFRLTLALPCLFLSPNSKYLRWVGSQWILSLLKLRF